MSQHFFQIADALQFLAAASRTPAQHFVGLAAVVTAVTACDAAAEPKAKADGDRSCRQNRGEALAPDLARTLRPARAKCGSGLRSRNHGLRSTSMGYAAVVLRVT